MQQGFIFIEHMVLLFFGALIYLALRGLFGDVWWVYIPLGLPLLLALIIVIGSIIDESKNEK